MNNYTSLEAKLKALQEELSAFKSIAVMKD
jgi:hypothetical protein